MGVKRQNGHHSGRLTPGVQHPGRSEKRPVIKEFWRLTPARAPGWALNAHNGQQMGVKRQNGCHSGRLTPERWGDHNFVFKSDFFKLSFSHPYFSTKIHFNLSSFTFKFSKSFFKSFPNFVQKLTLLSISYLYTIGLPIPPHHSNLLFSSLSSFLSFA